MKNTIDLMKGALGIKTDIKPEDIFEWKFLQEAIKELDAAGWKP